MVKNFHRNWKILSTTGTFHFLTFLTACLPKKSKIVACSISGEGILALLESRKLEIMPSFAT